MNRYIYKFRELAGGVEGLPNISRLLFIKMKKLQEPIIKSNSTLFLYNIFIYRVNNHNVTKR